MQRGYVKLWRKFKDSEIWKENRVFSKWEAWEDIFTSANHKDQTVIIGNIAIECKRGQCINSLETWRKRWSWGSKKKVRDFFMLLKKLGNIETENVSKTTRLTVCNYETYQESGNEKEMIKKRSRNDEETMRAPNNNDKKDNKEKNDKNYIYTWVSEKLKCRILEKRQQKITDDTIQKWNDIVRLMVERDNRKLNDIELLIDECHDMPANNNGFTWANNILSMQKLREKWNEGKIYIGMNRKNGSKQYTPQDMINDMNKDYGDMFDE